MFFDSTQEAEKKAYAAQMQDQCCTTAGTIGRSDEPARAGLQERLYMQQRRAERETVRAMKLAELLHLLEKNPEIARILDLLEEVGK